MESEQTEAISLPVGAAWHAHDAGQVLAALDTSRCGLSTEEADRRFSEYGPNRLPQRKAEGPLKRLLRQFHNFLIYVLLLAAALSAGLGHWVDAAVILAVVLVNAVVGFIQEGRAERSLEAIRRMADPVASLIRDGHRGTAPVEDLVPGDIVVLEAGSRVPADLRMIDAQRLRIDEAVLTGESVPVDKELAPSPEDTALAERTSMAFSGTLVVAGQGLGVVVATGAKTELGHISGMIGEVGKLETPLVRQMGRFNRLLMLVILAVSTVTFAYAMLLGGYEATEAFMVVVGLAVAAVPEALPAVLTITLAIGVRRMAARKAIIRRLPAVETLGAVSVIGTDKTGTLTRNEMVVRCLVTPDGTHEVSGEGYEPAGEVEKVEGARELIRAGLLCSDAELSQGDEGWTVQGDPMEGALIALAGKAGLNADKVRAETHRVETIPFDAEYKYMATRHRDGTVYIKGAPERVIAMCSANCPSEERDRWLAEAERLAQAGQRVLAFASIRDFPSETSLSDEELDRNARLLGLGGFIDPPRVESADAIRECREAGIRVVMITGDHASTARAIARNLDLAADPRVMTGSELDQLGEDQFAEAVREVDLFARATPAHKLKLVETLQAQGCTVAMTGDGVNDAPALRRADVGVAMGIKGTEASKEAAEMVLADDNFASITAAVAEGRTVYDNLRKVLAWTLPTNGGESMVILLAIALGLTLPLTPLQILWVNLITASALGLTLAFEPAEPGVMNRPPRPRDAALLSPALVWQIVFVSFLMVVGVFAVYFWAMAGGKTIETARTLVVNALVMMEIFYLFSVRYVHGRSLTLRGVVGTRPVLIGVSIVAVAQLAFTYLPVMQFLFDTRPLSLTDGVMVLATGVALFVLVELEKMLRLRRSRSKTPADRASA